MEGNVQLADDVIWETVVDLNVDEKDDIDS